MRRHRSGLYIPGGPIAARVYAAPIGYTRSGRAVCPIAGGAMTAAALRRESAPAEQGKGGTPAPAPVPFVRGSHEFTEGSFDDRSVTPGAASVTQGPVDVPARGWATAIKIQVEGSGGVLGAGVLSEDWPFNALDQLSFTRPNGDPYFGPMGGFSAFLANLSGGYVFESDPRANPRFLGGINCRFIVRIPLEATHHDAYAALINQDQAASYKVGFAVPASSTLCTTAPTTIPALRFRMWLEGWAQPPAADLNGRPIAQSPPGTPTAQFWSEQTFNIVGGVNTIRLTDVGNLMRTIVLVYRDNTAVRIRRDDELPQDSLRLTSDAREVENLSIEGWKQAFYEHYGVAAPAGVIVYDKTHDGEGHSGNEARNQYLPTSDRTRLEWIGTFGGDGGVLTVLTNDIAPSGVPIGR